MQPVVARWRLLLALLFLAADRSLSRPCPRPLLCGHPVSVPALRYSGPSPDPAARATARRRCSHASLPLVQALPAAVGDQLHPDQSATLECCQRWQGRTLPVPRLQYQRRVARSWSGLGADLFLSLDPSQILCELSAGFCQCDAVAEFNLYPSTRGSKLDSIGSSASELLDHALLHRVPVRVSATTHGGRGLGERATGRPPTTPRTRRCKHYSGKGCSIPCAHAWVTSGKLMPGGR